VGKTLWEVATYKTMDLKGH